MVEKILSIIHQQTLNFGGITDKNSLWQQQLHIMR